MTTAMHDENKTVKTRTKARPQSNKHNKKRSKKSKVDLHQQVTDAIIEFLEAGKNIPLSEQWRTQYGPAFPANYSTKVKYSGINTVILLMRKMKAGYKYNYWLTYKQAAEMGGQVRKGEASTSAVFYKTLKVEKDGTEETVPILNRFNLFNVEQIDGLEMPEDEELTDNITGDKLHTEVSVKFEQYLKNTGISFRTSEEDRACYIPGIDTIEMPGLEKFMSSEFWASTLVHEMAHSTGHEKRLDRKFGTNKGNKDYAFEELVAELTAAFVSMDSGFTTTMIEHASYVQSWLSALNNDKKFIFKAAAEAQKAFDFWLENSK